MFHCVQEGGQVAGGDAPSVGGVGCTGAVAAHDGPTRQHVRPASTFLVVVVVVASALLPLSACSVSDGSSSGPRAATTRANPGRSGQSRRHRTDHAHHGRSKPGPTGERIHPRGPTSRGWLVYDVVDGDTVKVAKGSRALTLRLIGIDTPEVVDPFKSVQCYGPAASANAHRVLEGRHVVLEFDRSQGRLDKYGRTLTYLWVVGSAGLWSYNHAALQHGFAKEYTYDLPYAWQAWFLHAQRRAQRQQAGLWSPRTCNGNTTTPAAAVSSGSGSGGHRCAAGYSPCLPVVADLDCSDIGHPVTVTGADQYGLDSDHDGVGCE
jgi:endonuclease YncB( thermonuclease family)